VIERGRSGSADSQNRRHAEIRKLVRDTYEDPEVTGRYGELGLWPSEESLILEFVPDNARILDLGCGAGRTSIPLAELGLTVTGIDISQRMVDLARQQAQLAGVEAHFEQMDSESLTLPDGSFDVALYSYNGIELIPGTAGKLRAMSQVHRILKPGGRFILSSHSIFALNRYALSRLASFLKFSAGRLLGAPVRERELGERFADDEEEEVKYLQVLPPGRLVDMLGEAGFRLLYFNTRKRLEAGREFGFTGHFEDGERFYVGQKV